jgi:hypothetical protein
MKAYYNTITQTAQVREPYLVNGTEGILPDNIIVLDVINTDEPTNDGEYYDRALYNVSLTYEKQDNNWVRTWTVVAKTEDELAREIALKDWLYPEYEYRLRVPKQLGEAYPDIYVHIIMEELPMIKTPSNDNMRDIYINTILNHHGTVLQEVQDVVELHLRPSILNPTPNEN